MKKSEFIQNRKVRVTSDQGEFEFTSYLDMLGNFEDVTNTEQWAKAHDNVVFVAHRFDTIGKIVDRLETVEYAVEYAVMLNEYFAIHEEYSVEDITPIVTSRILYRRFV